MRRVKFDGGAIVLQYGNALPYSVNKVINVLSLLSKEQRLEI